MKNLAFKMIASDGSTAIDTQASIPIEEWNRWLQFHQESERLRETKFVKEGRGSKVNVNFKVGEGIKYTADPVDPDEFGAMIHRLRPFVLQRECLYFGKVKNQIKRRIDSPLIHKHVDLLNHAFEAGGIRNQMQIRTAGREVLSRDFVMDWLNSYEYHRDATKKVQVDETLGAFRQFENGVAVVLLIMVEMIQAVLNMGAFIETIIQIESGERSEIQYPAEWAVK